MLPAFIYGDHTKSILRNSNDTLSIRSWFHCRSCNKIRAAFALRKSRVAKIVLNWYRARG